MGGHAFNDLGENAFPRMPTDTYERRKLNVHDKLAILFEFVGIPRERPDKPDHGDIDFIVYGSKDGSITPERVKYTIGADYLVKSAAANALGTSNYALLADDEQGKYYQVDVNVCQDKDEWDRVMFFHSYGDLGMILGLMARAYGFSLGTKGLRIISPRSSPESTPLPSLHLSSSFPNILPFFGLFYAEWETGFADTLSLFSWVRSSPHFDPRRFARTDPSGCRRDKQRKGRSMYQEFVEYAREIAEQEKEDEKNSATPVRRRKRDDADILQESLDYFGKREEFDAMVYTHGRRQRIKAKLSGTKVMQWTGLGNGEVIGKIMATMKQKFSDDEVLASEEEELKRAVLQLQSELGHATSAVPIAQADASISADLTDIHKLTSELASISLKTRA